MSIEVPPWERPSLPARGVLPDRQDRGPAAQGSDDPLRGAFPRDEALRASISSEQEAIAQDAKRRKAREATDDSAEKPGYLSP